MNNLILTIKFFPVILTVAFISNISCSRKGHEVYYDFDSIPDRVWVGEDFWTVPLEGWRVNDGRVECVSHLQQATFSNLTYVLEEGNSAFNVRFEMGLIGKGENEGSSGIVIGSQAIEDDDVRAAVYFGSGINMGVNTGGFAFLEDLSVSLPDGFDYSSFTLDVGGSDSSEGYIITMEVIDPEGNVAAELSHYPEDPVAGIIQFVNNFRGAGSSVDGPEFWFDNIYFSGAKFARYEANRFGPVLWTMHTLGRDIMKMTAMFPPVGESENHEARLQVRKGQNWQTVASGRMDGDSRSVTFRVGDWDSGSDHEYRVLFDYINSMGESRVAEYGGMIRRDPVDRPLRFGLMTCQHSNGFPYSPVVRNLEHSDPDILYFSGDQIYEGNGGYPHVRWPDDVSILNYLGKYYMFGWAFGDLMRDIPTVITPDDHDVYHGNLWGDGGVPFNDQKHLLEIDVRAGTGDQRGYLQTARWINAMHLTQISHLPDPYDPTPIEQDISVWYTDLNYGRVSFAIISDRMFKSPPELVSTWDGRNDHIVNPLDDPFVLDKAGLKMWGERQEFFMEEWIRDWRDIDMKVVLSQTPLAGTSTHHGNEGVLAGDLDSGGWPQTARNRALHLMRRCFAFHANGDQHLASIVQYGIDDYRDAGYGFSPPAISTGYQRWFLPDETCLPISNRPPHGLPNTGEYVDGFGNRTYMYAVGNPEELTLVRVASRYQNKQKKASGYGMVIFDQQDRDIAMECWRFLADVSDPGPGCQFPGWPHTISQFDNYGRRAAAWLPTVKVDGEPDPVIEVINQRTGELEYIVRISGNQFEPKVFSRDLFTIRLGYPEQDLWKDYNDLSASAEQGQQELNVSF
jgi:alkaline phosphatase D